MFNCNKGIPMEKKYIYYFLAFFITGFCLGAHMAIKNNLEPISVEETIDRMSENLRLDKNADTSYCINYRCGDDIISISFDTLGVTNTMFSDFTQSKSSVAFMCFDELYQYAGGGLLGWTFKDMFSSANSAIEGGGSISPSRYVKTFLAVVTGSFTGISLGYYTFINNKIDCTSKDVGAVFAKKDNIILIKEKIIYQLLKSNVVVLEGSDSLRCIYLGKVYHYGFSRIIDIDKFKRKNMKLAMEYLRCEALYYTSFCKLINRRFDLFNSSDLNNFNSHFRLLNIILSDRDLLRTSYKKCTIKKANELSIMERSAVNR